MYYLNGQNVPIRWDLTTSLPYFLQIFHAHLTGDFVTGDAIPNHILKELPWGRDGILETVVMTTPIQEAMVSCNK